MSPKRHEAEAPPPGKSLSLRVTKNLFAMKQRIAVLVKDISAATENTPYDFTEDLVTRYPDYKIESASSSVVIRDGRTLLVTTLVFVK